MHNFKGKTVVISGGGTGIGYEIAKTFLQYNANVYISGRRGKILNTSIQRLKNKDIKNKEKINLACLAGATDPRNIGSIIRSASAFNIDGLIVRERDYPDTSKLMYKAASGCIEHLKIFEVSNINTTLKSLREKNLP